MLLSAVWCSDICVHKQRKTRSQRPQCASNEDWKRSFTRSGGGNKHSRAGYLQGEAQKPDTDFQPNLVNTVCFLVQWVVQLTTFSVNYMGHPFNTSLLENQGLALALRWGTLGFLIATLNIVPGTAWALSLVCTLSTKETTCVLLRNVIWQFCFFLCPICRWLVM